MSKYELSLSRDYVPTWTHVDAVRELFQNALDQQTTVKDNAMFFNYDSPNQTLYIGNKSSVLNTKTLLLGSSTKRNDPNTIGQFGEGYKIATLVLTRLNKKVTFYNYGAKEVWNPRFVKAKRYDGEEILTFFIDKKFIWQRVPDNNLTITIENISQDEYKEIIASNLHLQYEVNSIQTEYGKILLDEAHKSKVFVNGLYVCDHTPFKYGYDFKPAYLKVDRDRSLARSIDIEWLSAKMWSYVDEDRTLELIEDNAADIHYMYSANDWGSKYRSITDKAYDKFKIEHGDNAVPVIEQKDYDRLNSYGTQFRPVFVSSSYGSILKASSKYEEPKPVVKKKRTTRERLEGWLKGHERSLTKSARNSLKRIIEDVLE